MHLLAIGLQKIPNPYPTCMRCSQILSIHPLPHPQEISIQPHVSVLLTAPLLSPVMADTVNACEKFLTLSANKNQHQCTRHVWYNGCCCMKFEMLQTLKLTSPIISFVLWSLKRSAHLAQSPRILDLRTFCMQTKWWKGSDFGALL